MRIITVGSLLVLSILVSGCSGPKGVTTSDKKSYVNEMVDKTLNELYLEYPQTKEKIQKSAGYGVFSNVNINVILLSAGNGFGAVIDNQTQQKTYMKMAMAGVGLGAGVKDFRAVIIFKNKETLNSFIDKGWEFGGHADAAIQADDKGASANTAGDINPDMEIYQFTKNGIALQATLAGTKYWKDNELND